MIVTTKLLKPTTFQPFSMTLTFETQEEFRDMSVLFSYYGQIPSVACHVFDEKYKRMQEICVKISDALEEVDQ